jgi:hypothetical protein
MYKQRMNTLLTLPEAVKYSGLSASRLRHLLQDGLISGVKTPAPNKYRGEWRVNKDSLTQYLATRKSVGRPRTK